MASTIVEMTYLMPVVLLTWIMILFGLFYYHDKNIIVGAAYETAVVGSEKCHENQDVSEEELAQYFQERIRGKLIFFPGASSEIEIEETKIRVTGRANKRGMRIEIMQSAAITFPERELRKTIILKESFEDILN